MRFVNPAVAATSKHPLAGEGTYFVLANPTPGTALAFAVNAASDFTKSLFIFTNSAAVGGTQCFLDYVKLIPTVVPASATSMQFALQLDATTRYSAGGTGPTAGVNVNGDSVSPPGSTVSVSSVGKWYYASGGAVITTAAAGANARLVARGTPRAVIPAVGDEIVISFGTSADIASSSGSSAGRSGTNAPPVIVGGGQSLVFNVWFPGNAVTGLSFEFECGWFER